MGHLIRSTWSKQTQLLKQSAKIQAIKNILFHEPLLQLFSKGHLVLLAENLAKSVSVPYHGGISWTVLRI